MPEVISGRNLNIYSERIPTGIYVLINVDLTRHRKIAIQVLSSAVWGDTVTLSLYK